MPVITIATHPLSNQEKTDLIAGLTTTAAQVTHLPETSFVILVDEYPETAIGLGGRTLAEVKASH